jgi:gliding motility-associated-like protein
VRPPDVSTAGADQQICNLRAVTLAANTPSAPSAGSWEIISGTGSIGTADLSNPNASVTGLAEGDLVLRWVIRNSPCAESADTITIHKDVLAAPILALTGASYDTCAFTTGITYSTTVDHSPGSTYSWAASGNPNTLVIASAANNRVVVNVGASGGILTVMEVRGACSLSASGNITIKPNITKADAGADQTICVDNTMLQATLLSFGKGQWTVIEGNGIFTDSSDAHTLVAGLNYGLNIFRWTVKGCGGPLMDDVNVIVGASQMKIGPLTGPTDTLCVGTPRMLTLTVSGGSSHYFYVWKSSDSSFNSVLTYTPVIVVPLINTTTYYVYAVDSVNHGCMSMSDSIVVQSISKQNLTMNNLMTPNNDNMNDKFIVRDIETLQKALPGTSLEIFNEWGSRVFQTDSYDNTWEAPALTDGVYYYHLKAGCGSDVYKGWVQILR